MTLEVIEIGALQAPYKEFNITIPANGNKKINYLHSTLEVLESNSSNFTVSLGGAEETTLKVGIIYKYQRAGSGNQGALPFVNFINRTNSAITLTVAFGAGDISDHRQIGQVTVSGNEDAPVFVRESRPTSTTLVTLNVAAGDSGTWTPPAGAFCWGLQNNTAGDVTIYGGIILPAGGFYRSNSLAAVAYSCAAAGSLNIVYDS